MMTKISMLTTLLFIFQIGICQSNDRNNLKNFEIEFNKIILNLDSVISNSKNQNETLVSHYNFIKSKIYNKELSIVYDSTLNYDFFGCASFNIALDNPKHVTISYGQFVVDKYKNYPALIYAIIINTFQSAYDYYNNQDLFLISTKNQIEKTYFEIDAMTLEAIFLNVYMKSYPKLGYLEKYLIADLSNNLSGSSVLFNKTDLELLHRIDNLKSEKKSADRLLMEFNTIGKELVTSVTFNSDSKWVNYCSIITLKTYVFYSMQVIFDIVHLKNGVSADLFKLDDYPDNLKTINQIQKIINDNNSFLSYYQETLKMYGDYYKK